MIYGRSLEERFTEKFEKTDGCWLWTAGVGSHGYGMIRESCSRIMLLAHRVSYELYIGEIPDVLHVLHSCDMPSCVNPGHLFLGTRSDNSSDMCAKGRQAKGEANSQSKLTEHDVRMIRVLRGVFLQREIAQQYGVSRKTISLVHAGKSWTHV